MEIKATMQTYDLIQAELRETRQLQNKLNAERFFAENHGDRSPTHYNFLEQSEKVLRWLAEREQILGHHMSELRESTRRLKTPYTPHTWEQLRQASGYALLKRPLPMVSLLQEDKELVILKVAIPKSGYAADSSKYFKALRQNQDDYAAWKAANPGDPRNMEYEAQIHDLRQCLRALAPQSLQYTFKRGPFQYSVKMPAFNFPKIREAYYALRKTISHQRFTLRQPTYNNGKFGSRVGAVYLLPERVIERRKEVGRKKAYEEKRPETKVKHVGIELEFCSPFKGSQIADLLIANALDKNVALKSDGSLRASHAGDRTHELTILTTEREYVPLVSKICDVLKQAKGYVNKTCGMHVHLDMRTRQGAVAYQRLVTSLDILYAITPHDRKWSKYCVRNAPDMEYRTNDLTRYWAVNAGAMSRHNTIEVRLHSGTLNALKINSWVQLLVLIVETENKKSYRTVANFCAGMRVPAALAAYMSLRERKFIQEEVEHEEEQLQYTYSSDGSGGPLTPVCLCSGCRGNDSANEFNLSIPPTLTPRSYAVRIESDAQESA